MLFEKRPLVGPHAGQVDAFECGDEPGATVQVARFATGPDPGGGGVAELAVGVELVAAGIDPGAQPWPVDEQRFVGDLDGCGTGGLVSDFRARGYEAYGCDTWHLYDIKPPSDERLREIERSLRQVHNIDATLREQLAQAVANEDYETAAQLRDALRRRG